MKEETLHPKDPAGKTTLRPGVLLLGGVGGVTRGIACKEYPGSRWESTSSQAARSHCSIVVTRPTLPLRYVCTVGGPSC